MSTSPTAWVTAGARSVWATSSTRAEESITTGIVGVFLPLDILQAQGGGDLGLPLGPFGPDHLRRLAGAKLDRFPGCEPFEPLPAAGHPQIAPDQIEHVVGQRHPLLNSTAAQGLVQLLGYVLHLDRSHGHERSMLLACR